MSLASLTNQQAASLMCFMPTFVNQSTKSTSFGQIHKPSTWNTRLESTSTFQNCAPFVLATSGAVSGPPYFLAGERDLERPRLSGVLDRRLSSGLRVLRGASGVLERSLLSGVSLLSRLGDLCGVGERERAASSALGEDDLSLFSGDLQSNKVSSFSQLRFRKMRMQSLL